jgi:hypothetical protein
MKKRDRGRIWWLLLVLLVAVATGLAGFFLGVEKGREERRLSVSKKIPSREEAGPQAKAELKTAIEKKAVLTEEIRETEPLDEEDFCSQIENGVQGFFRYLNKKNYIQHLEADMDTYDRFKKLIRELSSSPPIPAGEGIDSKIITRNIFYFSRVLEKEDLLLIKEIIGNETDTLEINLDMFYKWLMLGERCPDREGIKPPLNALYQYAGFFTNTIGGRTYLFRRPIGVRLLVSYYCLLIVHDADKRGKNIYGIDIFPEIAPLLEEISIYPDFQYQEEYLHRLTSLQNYYFKRR